MLFCLSVRLSSPSWKEWYVVDICTFCDWSVLTAFWKQLPWARESSWFHYARRTPHSSRQTARLHYHVIHSLSSISPPMQAWTVTEEELLVAAKSQRVICDVTVCSNCLVQHAENQDVPKLFLQCQPTLHGATLSLCWQCEGGHQGNWSNSKRCKSKTGYPFFLNDLLAASAVLLSGNHYFKLAVLCKFLNLQLSQSKSKSQAICLTSSRFLQTASRQPQNRTHRTPAALHSHPLPPRRALAHLPLHAHLTASYQQG
jgi:hypothetical protein